MDQFSREGKAVWSKAEGDEDNEKEEEEEEEEEEETRKVKSGKRNTQPAIDRYMSRYGPQQKKISNFEALGRGGGGKNSIFPTHAPTINPLYGPKNANFNSCKLLGKLDTGCSFYYGSL